MNENKIPSEIDSNRRNELNQSDNHNQCVDETLLINFVQAIGLLLQEELSKDDLIKRLNQMAADLVKPIESSKDINA